MARPGKPLCSLIPRSVDHCFDVLDSRIQRDLAARAKDKSPLSTDFAYEPVTILMYLLRTSLSKKGCRNVPANAHPTG